MAKLIKNNRILLNDNVFPREEASKEVLLAKERILKLIQAWDDKQIESWIQKEQEEQAVQSFTPNWNFSMIDDEEVLQSRKKLIKDIQPFLEKFSRYAFEVMPKILSIAWERLSEIKHAITNKQYQPEEIQELMCKLLEDVQNIREGLAEFINSSSWNRPTFYDNDEEYSILYKEYLENSSNAITPSYQLKNLSTLLYEVTSDDESECDVPIKDKSSPVFTTFSNPIFDDNDDFTFSNNESLFDENVSMEDFKVYSNPLFDDDEINYDELDSYCFNAESDFVESLSNHDTLIDSSLKFDYLEEFSGALMPTSIVDEERIRREHEEYISLMEKLFSINSFPRPLENFHANTIVETLPISHILIEDSDSQREEIDIFTDTDELLPPCIKCDDYDSEGDVHFLEELLVDDSISIPENKSSNFDHHDDPSFPRPPPKPPDVEFFFDLEPELISVVFNNIDKLNEDECFNPGGEIDVFANIEDDDYFPLIFFIRIFLPYLIFPEVFPLLLSAKSEDTIFDPGISV
uniref:Reverse transcriptase domain-containing protein n=1 Tax=Tanacetum cinerariifolium TaxID=118510 RepID=A0A6L2J9L0_TANCI|nr:hypothetical protein [Tanacetum cinerariifolium]